MRDHDAAVALADEFIVMDGLRPDLYTGLVGPDSEQAWRERIGR